MSRRSRPRSSPNSQAPLAAAAAAPSPLSLPDAMRRATQASVLGLAMAVGALTALPAQAQSAIALPTGATLVTSVEGITEYRLANGLRVLLFPDASKETITVNITYLVGSRHENYGETGMAHLLEHMLFKGSTRHPNVPKELSDRGARPNGTTSFDRTNYYETFAASDDNLRWALDLEADRMVNAFVAKKDLDSEFSVVRNEYEMGENSPGMALFKKMQHAMFGWHNYGKLPIGNKADIENVPIDRLQAFYRMYYQPDNAVLMVAGKIDPAKTLAMVGELFGKTPKPTRVLPRFYTAEPAQDGEQSVTVRRVGDVGLIAAGYHVPASTHPDLPALGLLADVLGNAPSGRLYKALVDTKLAANVGAGAMLSHDPGAFRINATLPKAQSHDTAMAAMLKVMDELATQPVTADELERARTRALKGFDNMISSSQTLGLVLSEAVASGDWRLFFLQRDRIRAVTLADVQRVAATYFKADNRTLGRFVPVDKPDRVDIPARTEPDALVKDYKGDLAQSEGEAFDPTPENIERRTLRTTTPGGMRLALLPKTTRSGVVQLSLRSHFGDLQNLSQGQNVLPNLAAAMLMRGTQQLTRQQLQDKFDQLKANVSVGGADTGFTVNVETRREQLPEVLRLIRQVLREPAFPASEFEQLRQSTITGLESQKREPQALASVTVAKQTSPYPPNHPFYVTDTDERLARYKAAKLDDVKAFYRNFYGTDHAELSAVGDFDAKALQAQVQELFGDWKSPARYERIPSLLGKQGAASTLIETPDKANAMLLGQLSVALNDDHPDHAALSLGNYLLGGGVLNSRISQRLRQKDGLSYGAGSQYFANALDATGTLTVYAIFAPQNLAKVELAFRQVFEDMLTQGVTAEEVAAAKGALLQSIKVSRAQDRELAAKLVGDLFIGRTLQRDLEVEKRINALTPDSVLAALKKHVSWDRFTVVKAGDFAKAAAK